LARSVYKLEEIDKKYHIFDDTVTSVLDIGCAPGSWLQWVNNKMPSSPVSLSQGTRSKVIGIDLKEVEVNLPGVDTYVQDAADRE